MNNKHIYQRYKELNLAMEQISGFEIEKNIKSRKYPHPIIRSMIYNQLYKDGYTLNDIANVFNKDHSTVSSALQFLYDIMDHPEARYSAIVDIYNKFIDSVGESMTIKLYPSQWEALKKLTKIICEKETS